MPDDTEDDDNIALARERLQAARRALSTAYDQRPLPPKLRLAAVRPDLLDAFSAAERAVFAAEVEMKDAEYALAVASALPPSTPGSPTPTEDPTAMRKPRDIDARTRMPGGVGGAAS